MARVSLYQGGNVQRQGTTGARFQPANFGPGIGESVAKAGQVLSDAVERQDQIEDINARVEANRLAVEHSEHVREIGRTVNETLGEGADAAANEGVGQLDQVTNELLGRASPRARMLLENDLQLRRGVAADSWLNHGFQQKSAALESSSVARIGRVVEDAADIDDENAALAVLDEVRGVNARRASFFGKGADWADAENDKAVSNFYASRALKLATSLGENGGAYAAIQYASKNRAHLNDEDYNRIVNAYDNEAIQDWAFARANGYDSSIVGVSEEPPTDQTVPVNAVQEAPDGKPVIAARADPSTVFRNLIVPNEGSTYVIDNNGHGAKYGVNAKFNPGVDVKNLTAAGAERIFIDKYWKPSGADKLPPALAAIHADTYYLNPTKAAQILRASGGDPDQYMTMRRSFLAGLHQSNPAKYPDYESRNRRVEAYADRLGDGGALPQIDVTTNMSSESIKDAVFKTPGVGMRLKRAYHAALIDKKNALRSEREERESETARMLTTQVLGLGDNFTSLTQLPQNLVTQASPSTLQTLSNMARSNVEQKPVPLNVETQLATELTINPKAFADPKTLERYAKLGVPPKRLAQLAQAGGQALGTVGKPDPVSQSEVEGAVRNVFAAHGLDIWTTQEKSGTKAAVKETQEDARLKLQLLGFIDQARQTWAVNNPGKRPGPDVINGWAAHALKQTQPGRFAFDAGKIEVYNSINPAIRKEVHGALKRVLGRDPTVAEVYDAYREGVFLGRYR